MTRASLLFAVTVLAAGTPLGAQDLPRDARESRLAGMLPPPAADNVRLHVTAARALGLPADAITLRALELSAKGATADEVVAVVESLAARLAVADRELRAARAAAPTSGEIVAAADALGRGLRPAELRALAGAAGGAEPLTTQLIILTGLMDRGLPAGDALDAALARRGRGVRPPHAAEVVGAAAADAPPPLVPAAMRGRRDHVPQPPGSPGPMPQVG